MSPLHSAFLLIGGALIASALLKALAESAENVETDLSEDISEHAEYVDINRNNNNNLSGSYSNV